MAAMSVVATPVVTKAIDPRSALAMRDSESARVSKKYLPEAQTEDQFRVMVRVAKDFGLREEISPLPNETEEQ